MSDRCEDENGELEMDPVGVYIHIPFCTKKCNYCDFPSYPGLEGIFHSYGEAVCLEIERIASEYGNISVQTVFFGGGTPSLLPVPILSRIVNTLMQRFRLSEDAEITLEANPGTVHREKAAAWRELGFNRISLGLQAAQDRLLQLMGRIHTRKMFVESIEILDKYGFHNLNADILFGVPGQSLEDWLETLDLLLQTKIHHISAYSLQIEKDTPWFKLQKKGELPYVDESLEREMYYQAIETLKKFGFHHYEISNFSKPGFECRHNLKYWTGKPYIGVGAAAHSFIRDERTANITNPALYIQKIKANVSPMISSEKIDPEEKLSERLILGLRIIDGVSMLELEQEFGPEALDRHRAAIERMEKRNLLYFDGDMLRLTTIGLDYANQVWMEFL